MNTSIIMIPAEELHPHPNNPRRDTGDVSELAESLKANGVLQNLTVVPGHWLTQKEWGKVSAQYRAETNPEMKEALRQMMNHKWAADGYTVIIGHRRLAAAKKAGLKEMPCTIANLTEKEQISTMLTENMQRTDLTAIEQAQGFQMMLDMGETVEGIAEKSGFSQSTVRRRLKIAELDNEKLKAASERQITMGDFDELAKVESLATRNKLLESIGTANFKNALQTEIKNQEWEKRKEEWLKAIRTFATEDPDATWQTKKQVACYNKWNMDEDVIPPAEAGKRNYYYRVSAGEINVYTDKSAAASERETREDAERAEQQRRRELKYATFRGIDAEHFQLRWDFVTHVSGTKCKMHMAEIAGLAADVLAGNGYNQRADPVKVCQAMGTDTQAEDWADESLFTENEKTNWLVRTQPEKLLLCLIYCSADGTDYKTSGYWDRNWEDGEWHYTWRENRLLDRIYETLESLGYEPSDEEKAMQDGSHGIFKPGYFGWEKEE